MPRDIQKYQFPSLEIVNHKTCISYRNFLRQLVERLIGGFVIKGPSFVVDTTGIEAQSSDDPCWCFSNSSCENYIYFKSTFVVVENRLIDASQGYVDSGNPQERRVRGHLPDTKERSKKAFNNSHILALPISHK